jgi:hypothetical protein
MVFVSGFPYKLAFDQRISLAQRWLLAGRYGALVRTSTTEDYG